MKDAFDGLLFMTIGFFVTVPFAIWKLNIEPIDVEYLLEKSGVSEYNNFKE